jgi:hypothetical protein
LTQLPPQNPTTNQQPEPVSLSQEREQQNNQTRFGAANTVARPDGSQAVQQVVSNTVTNYNLNAPASTQSQSQSTSQPYRAQAHGAANHIN